MSQFFLTMDPPSRAKEISTFDADFLYKVRKNWMDPLTKTVRITQSSHIRFRDKIYVQNQSADLYNLSISVFEII